MDPQAPDTMTPAQLDRRARLIEAVIALIGEGADEDVQMKDIAERAGVALGTVYRYFSSKDHLLAAALLEWASRLEQGPAGQEPATGGSAVEQLGSMLHHALRAYRRQPNFARLLVFVANSPDPFASACFQQMGTVVFATLGRAFDGTDDDTRDSVLRILGAVWYHGLAEWVKGRMTIDEVSELLDSTCSLLLAGHTPAVVTT